MAAAAEAALPDAAALQHAQQFATVMWERFSSSLLDRGSPERRFAHLIHELGMKQLAVRIQAEGMQQQPCNTVAMSLLQ